MSDLQSWKDSDLIRKDGDEDFLQTIDLEDTWQQLFTAVEVMFTGEGRGMVAGTWRAFLKGMLWQAKKRAAADPIGTRDYVIQSMQMICACLRVEPRELFPDLTPTEPDKAVA